MKTQLALLAASLFVLSASTAQALELSSGPQLNPTVLAEVIVSGGFMAPGASNTRTYSIKKDGSIELSSWRRGDLTPGLPLVTGLGKLDPAVQNELERAIARVHAGKLVDQDPNGPTGADAQDLDYFVNQNGKTIEVASRAGNFHTYALKQKAALVIFNILKKAIQQ